MYEKEARPEMKGRRRERAGGRGWLASRACDALGECIGPRAGPSRMRKGAPPGAQRVTRMPKEEGLISIVADGHTVSNTPDLFRPPKLSGTGPGQY